MPRVRAAIKPSGSGPVPAPAPNPAGASSMLGKRPQLRRAASAVPALPPTPPRTTHKRKRRSRSRVTDSSSEDEGDDVPVPEPESDREDEENQRKDGVVVRGHKRRKVLTLDAIAEELSETRAEEEFWLGKSEATTSTVVGTSSGAGSRTTHFKHTVVKTRARSRTRSPSSSPPPAPYLLRRGHTGLFSPPPSRRAPTIVPRPATPPPTVRRTREKEKATGAPERDSPNNPFLADDSPASLPASEDLSSPEPHTPKKFAEKPMLQMVFRGVKTVVANPHYVSPEVAALQEERAKLPIRHPDFDPLEAGGPKLLFPEARKRDLAARRRAHPAMEVPSSPTPTTSKRSRAGSTSSEESRGRAKKTAGPSAPGPSTIVEEEEPDVETMSAVLAANIARRMRKGVLADGDEPRTRPSSRGGELPELPEKDRTDPIKRALGPPRRA